MIPATYRASSSYLLRHPWQLVLAVVGIGIGVAVIVAVDLANASARKAFTLSMDAITGKSTHQIIGGSRGIPDTVYSDLRIRHGFRAIAPVVEDTVHFDGVPLTLLGLDIFAEPGIRNLTFGEAPKDGSHAASRPSVIRRFLLEPGSVAMTRRTAEELGLPLGESFQLVAGGVIQTARLIAVFEGANGNRLERVVIADIATAQEWLGMGGSLSRIDVRLSEDGTALNRLEAALPDGTRVLSAAGRTRATADMSNAFMTNLRAMSLLALLVGVFLIFNSVGFSVLQRRRLIGVLRALGLTRRQLVAMLLAEAALIGIGAAALGCGAGVVLGEKLLELVSQTINDLYYRVTVTEVLVAPASLARGLAAGLLASLVAAAVPAWEAASYQPRLALTRSTLETRTRRALPLVTASGLVLILLALALIGLSGTNLPAGLTAVFLLILGFALLIPEFVRTATKLLAPLADRIGGASIRMAVSGISAGLSRTAVAIVALTVAVSATVGVGVMVESFRGSVSAWLRETLQADFYVAPQFGPMDPAAIEAVRRVEGVAALSSSRRVWLEDATGRTQLRVIEMAPGSYAGTELLDADPAEVWNRWESEDVVLVSEPYAFQHAVEVGDSITLPTSAGPHEFVIAATFQSYDVVASAVLMSRARYAVHFDDEAIDSVGVYLFEGTEHETVSEALQSLESGGQPLRVRSNSGLRERSLQIFDRTFIITDVLYWLALGVAAIGILSAMLALQLERAREFGTLRALGMTPRQIRGLITTQAGVIGLMSGLASIPLGLVMALVLIKVINRRAFGWQIDMMIAPEVLVSATVFALVVALIAGLFPAFRAGRVRPAVAMREE